MNARALARALAPALLAAGLGVPAPAPAAPPAGFSFGVLPDTLRSNEDGLWLLDVRVVNGTGRGIYGDSLLLVVTPAGEPPGGPGAVTLLLPVPAGAKDLSAGDSAVTRLSVGATAARARLEVRLHAHTLAGEVFEARGVALATGSVLEDRYPARTARVADRAVEWVKVVPPAGAANGAGVLLLPGEGLAARAMLAPAARLAREGFSVVIVSAPGRGGSQGPDDFAGPASRAAALAALDTLLGLPGVERSRVGAWGVSRGATLALALALERPGTFAAVAAQGGCYDLWAVHRAAPPELRQAIEAAAGRDSAGWRARSPLVRAGELRAALLVHHGERDGVFPVASARAFADAARAGGGDVLARVQPGAGHELPVAEALRFLRSRLATP